MRTSGWIHSGKLTWQWNMDHLKMYFLLSMGIFHCYVSLPECNYLLLSLEAIKTRLKITHYPIFNFNLKG